MPTHNPVEDVVSWLSGQTINSRALVAGTNLFACEPRIGTAFPAKCIFVWASTGGGRPMPYLGVARSLWFPRLQVRVRGDPDAVSEARLTARALMHVLHVRAGETGPTGYISLLVNESEPIPLGEQASGGASFQLNVDLRFAE